MAMPPMTMNIIVVRLLVFIFFLISLESPMRVWVGAKVMVYEMVILLYFSFFILSLSAVVVVVVFYELWQWPLAAQCTHLTVCRLSVAFRTEGMANVRNFRRSSCAQHKPILWSKKLYNFTL